MTDTTTAGRRRRWRMTSMALLAAMALVMAACGGDDAEEATGDSAAAGAGQAATGEPIKVMTEAPVDTQLLPLPEHPRDRPYVRPVDQRQGRHQGPARSRSSSATTGSTPAKRQLRPQGREEKVVANVGGFTLDVSQGIPIYEENKIAWFGECCPMRDQEFNSKISFPIGLRERLPDGRRHQDDRGRM